MLKRTKKSNTDVLVLTTSSLLDVLAPSAIKFSPKSITFGEVYARILVVIDYPNKVFSAWFSKIAGIPGVISSIHLSPTDPYELIQQINKSVGELLSLLNKGGSARDIQRAEQKYNDAMEMLKKIDQEQQNVFFFSAVLMITAEDMDNLERKTRMVQSALASSGMRGRVLMFRQEDGIKAAGPFCQISESVKDVCARNMPSETVAASFPFTDSGFNDGSGFVLGRDKKGGIILLDVWKRGNDRTNSNFTVLGKPGMGKSTAIKKILLNLFSQGAKIIVIDPEREYMDFCRNLRGDWIDCGGGTGGRINPLQIKSIPNDDEEDKQKLYSDSRGPMSLHIQTLRTFFKLYFKNLSEVEIAILEKAVEELYLKFGIDWNTNPDDIPNFKWPVIKDLYDLIVDKAKERPDLYEKLSILLRRMAVGADSVLWNGQTTIKSNSDVVILDVNSLQEADEVVKRAQYFNVLTWAWNEISKNRTEKVILAVDECYLLIDPEIPQSLQFLRNVSKRIRKYEGGLMVISQNVVDFIDPSVKRYGQALLDNPCYKLLMGQGENDLDALTKLMKFSEAEIELLSQGKRGEALLVAGNRRVHAMIELADFEPEIFGEAGGR